MSRFLIVLPILAMSATAGATARTGIGSDDQVTSISTPVVGGSTAPLGKWPDAVAVLGPDGSCTGTLIAPTVVLTAGHCAGIHPTQVIANTVNYNAPGGIKVGVKSVTAYPNWQHTFDVSVVVLADPITSVTPRRVGTSCTFRGFKENMEVHLVGFGLTDATGKGNNTQLHEAMAPVLDASCSGGNGCEQGASPAGEFVAGGGGTDSCFGDSGGPVYYDTPRGTFVIAAVSRGLDNTPTPCGGGGIYVRTDKVLAWIEETTGESIAQDDCTVDAAADIAAASPDAGGCSVGGGGVSGAGLLGAIALLGLVRKRR